jgi:hypothetical protein
MKKRYRLELDVVLDDVDESKAIQIARKQYQDAGSAEQLLGEHARRDRAAPPEEFVCDDAREAIMELVTANDLLRKAGITVAGVNCMGWDSATIAPTERLAAITEEPIEPSIDQDAPGTADLDDFETGMYLCRWPNGEFSLVMAPSRRDALVELDEWAPAHPSQLVPMNSCMVDFRLSDEGRIELTEFGEDTGDFIWKTAYPALDEIRCSDGVMLPDGEYTPKGKELIRKAVERERTRLRDNQPVDAPAETEAGKELQKKLGMAGPVADHYVQQGAKRILESGTGKKGKPN